MMQAITEFMVNHPFTTGGGLVAMIAIAIGYVTFKNNGDAQSHDSLSAKDDGEKE